MVFCPCSPIDDFLASIQSSWHDGTFVKITCGDRREKKSDLRLVFAKKVQIKSGEKMSFTYRYERRDEVKNYSIEEAVGIIRAFLEQDFSRGELFLTTKNIVLLRKNDGSFQTKKLSATITQAPDVSHDTTKKRYIETVGNVYLRALGVTDENGGILPSMQDKFRQIDKFVEIIESLVRASKISGKIKVADMGSGKGYLTFATYDFLQKNGFHPEIVGVEYRQELADFCNVVAKKSGFEQLSFRAGTISDSLPTSLDMLIALHACDTATDDAIFSGIMAGQKLLSVHHVATRKSASR